MVILSASWAVVVWLKIRENDILTSKEVDRVYVVVWLKIRENDIVFWFVLLLVAVVVWLKIRENDIKEKKTLGL